MGAILLLVAGSVGCSKPGVKELRQSRAAVRAASSWQSDVTGTAPGSHPRDILLEKVECPSRRDLMLTTRPPEKSELDKEGRIIVHEIRYDGDWYTSDGRSWNHFAGAQKNLPGKLPIGCGEGPARVWDGALYADLDDVIGKGEIRRGQTAQIDGGACTWWEVAPAKDAPAHYSVCVGDQDHLPREVRSHEKGNEYTYTLSHWNQTSVTLPQELAQ
jgi:hypothetical protein